RDNCLSNLEPLRIVERAKSGEAIDRPIGARSDHATNECIAAPDVIARVCVRCRACREPRRGNQRNRWSSGESVDEGGRAKAPAAVAPSRIPVARTIDDKSLNLNAKIRVG